MKTAVQIPRLTMGTLSRFKPQSAVRSDRDFVATMRVSIVSTAPPSIRRTFRPSCPEARFDEIVALKPVEPFMRDCFMARVDPFATWAVDFIATVEIAGRSGWDAHLRNYRWAGGDWQNGLRSRSELTAGLSHARDEDELLDAIGDIAEWGGMAEPTWEDLEEIARTLPLLDSVRDGGYGWEEIFARRIATVSKAYAMHDPDAWTIYDSRVAAALAKLVDRWWRATGQRSEASLLCFGMPLGRAGRRPDVPRSFPILATPGQARLNFIYASWLLRRMVALVCAGSSSEDSPDWRLVHIEMALFMLGDRFSVWT
jgi:hypothetical protein